MKMFTVITFCAALVTGALSWSYTGDDGVDHWADDYETCGGMRQSPIDIDTDYALDCDDSLIDFEFHGYDSAGLGLKLKNNGHAAQVDVSEGASVSGGGLHENYLLAQFHMHWGSNSAQGSEHLLNGHEYPMEVHFVHFAESRGSLGEAADKPFGLAVLGFFFEIGEHNDNFDEIVNNLAQVREQTQSGQEYTLNSFALSTLLPQESSPTYYRYHGSLTTPGCFQSVIWTVFETPIHISEEQMEQFRMLTHEDDEGHSHAIVDNYRPPQDLNGRNIFTNKMMAGPDPPSSATSVVVSMMSLVVSMALAKIMC